MPAHVLGRDLVGYTRHRARTAQFNHLREHHVVTALNRALRAPEAALQGDVIGVHAAHQARIRALHQLRQDARDAALTRGDVLNAQARIDHAAARRSTDRLAHRRIGGGVVTDDQLRVAGHGGQRRGHGAPDRARRVARRQDDGQLRHGTPPASRRRRGPAGRGSGGAARSTSAQQRPRRGTCTAP